LPLTLPPLRERREDIPLLVEHFVATSCKRHRQPPRAVSPEVMQALSEAAWPGNVRELQHYIERAVVTTSGSDLTCSDIVTLGSKPPEEGLRTVVRDAVSLTERTRIVEALKKTGGNRLKAAKLLKISRAGLYNKLREYNLQ
jgi:two-component system response regulator AtoC